MLMVVAWLFAAGSGLAASQCPQSCTCSQNDSRVSCTGLNLLQVPPELAALSETVQILDLSRNNLTHITANILANFSQLHLVNLSHNHLVNISIYSFATHTAIKTLLLDYNNLDDTQLKFGSYMPVSSLTSLSVSNNAFDRLPDEWGKGFQNLQQLDLSGNNIADISQNSFILKMELTTQQFELHSTSRSVNSSFGVNDSGQSNSSLVDEYVPVRRWTSMLPSLKDINLANNNITNIDASGLEGLYSLEMLDLSSNKLTVVNQNWFENMTTLTYLYISNNPITDIFPFAFYNCSSLREIHAQRLKNLTKIYQYSFAGLLNIRVLNLSGSSSLTFIHPYSLQHMHRLNAFDIQGAGLKSIHPELLTSNRSDSLSINLVGNPWSCDCDLRWLKHRLTSNNTDMVFIDSQSVKCTSPPSLMNTPIVNVPHDNFSCYAPKIIRSDKPAMFAIGSKAVLDCQVDGNPMPSITWITSQDLKFQYHARFWDATDMDPGDLKYHIDHHWHNSDIYIRDMSHDNRIHVLENGSLYIDYIMRKDAGPYVCVAKNYLGNDTVTIRLRLSYVIIKEVTVWSMLAGFTLAGAVLFIAVIVGVTRHLCKKCSRKDREQRKGISEVLDKMLDYKINQLDKFSAYKTAKIDKLSAFKTLKIEKISAYKTAKIGQLTAFKSAKIDKLRTYKQMTVTSVLQHLEKTGEHYNLQMSRIRESCSQQGDRLLENYNTQADRFKDYRSCQVDKLRENYQNQVLKVRDYGHQQLERLREQYKMQQMHILKLLELLDVGNCMTAIENECMRTESMLFDTKIHFDLEPKPVHLLREHQLDTASDDYYYYTASSNSEHSSDNDITQSLSRLDSQEQTSAIENSDMGEKSKETLNKTDKKSPKGSKTEYSSETDETSCNVACGTPYDSSSDIISSCYESAFECHSRADTPSDSEDTLIVSPCHTSDSLSSSTSSILDGYTEETIV